MTGTPSAAGDVLAGYAGPHAVPAFRDVAELEELGTLAAPHRLRLGVDMFSLPPPPLFQAAALPARVAADHRGRACVPGAAFHAVAGYQLGSYGLLQRQGRVLVDNDVQPHSFNEMIRPDGMPPHWVRGLFAADAEIVEHDGPVGVALNTHLVWGHFLLEMLARVHLLATLRTLGRPVPIAVPIDAPVWVREFIALYFSARQTVTYNSEWQRIRAPAYVLPTMMMAHYHLHPALNVVVQELLDRVVGTGPPPPGAPRRLYLSRGRHRGWHALANEAEVEATLVDLGFTVVHPQELPLRAQLAIFSHAECIVSQYGSGAHNALFAPPGTPVFVLGWMNHLQSSIATLRRQPVGYMAASDGELIYPPPNRAPGVYRFHIDCRALARVVPAFLRFARSPHGPDAAAVTR